MGIWKHLQHRTNRPPWWWARWWARSEDVGNATNQNRSPKPRLYRALGLNYIFSLTFTFSCLSLFDMILPLRSDSAAFDHHLGVQSPSQVFIVTRTQSR